MKTKPILYVGSLLLTLPLLTHGQNYFFDDFQDDSLNSVPALSGSNVGDSYGPFANDIFVNSNPESNGNTSTQVLQGGGSSTVAAHNTIAFFDGGAQSIDGLILSYDFYTGTGTGVNDGIRIAFVGDADNNRDMFIRNDRNGLIKLDGNDQIDVNFGVDTWQNFHGEFSYTSGNEFDLNWTVTNLETSATVFGNQTVAFNASTFTDLKTRGILLEVFQQSPATNQGYLGFIDNVSATSSIPEPQTYALVCVALTGFFMTHRKKAKT